MKSRRSPFNLDDDGTVFKLDTKQVRRLFDAFIPSNLVKLAYEYYCGGIDLECIIYESWDCNDINWIGTDTFGSSSCRGVCITIANKNICCLRYGPGGRIKQKKCNVI